MSVRDTIAELGTDGVWYYDGWMGLSPNLVEPWYSAQCERSNGSGSVSGPHRATLEEAEADIERLFLGDGLHEPYDVTYVTKQEPALKITIARDVLPRD